MRASRLLIAVSSLLSLSACASSFFGSETSPPPGSSKAQPVIDSNTRLLALSVGTVAGSQLGGNIGRKLTDGDRRRMLDATQRALETGAAGQAVFWNSPDSGNSGSITPQSRFTTASGAACREFQQMVTVNGDMATAYGTACKQADGGWTVVSG